MAFGSSLSGNTADVKLVADTGQFNAEIDQAERNWRESINSMSREALKLDVANDRLRTSLAKYGAESTQAKRATIALKDAEEQATRAARGLDSQMRRTGSGMGSVRRLAGQLTAAVGIYGLAMGLRSATEAAKEQELVLGQTSIAVEAAGLSFKQYEDQINAVIRAQSQLGFDDEALMKTFQMFVRSTRDVSEALELNALAADVARGRYIDLEQAAQIVNKANLGMSGALRRIGLDVDKTAGRVELLNTLTRNYGQAAEEASDTATAATDRLSVEWENMKEIVGTGLLPAVTSLADRLSDYFGNAENQAEVQRRVNEAMETGEEVVRGIAGAFRITNAAISPFVKLVGGAENAVKLLLLAMAVGKVLSFARAIRLVGTNARFAAGQMGFMAAASRGLGGAPILGVNPVVAVAAAGVAAGVAGWRSGHAAAIDSGEFAKLKQAAISGRLGPNDLAQLQGALTTSQFRELRALVNAASSGAASSPDSRTGMTRGGGQGAQAGGGGGGGGGRGGPTESDLLLDVARPGNEVGDLRRLQGFYARQIRVLEAKKNLSEKQKAELRRLYGEIAGIQSQLDAIADEEEQKLADQQAKADEKRKAAAEKRARDREAGREALQQLNQDADERRRKFNQRVQKMLADSGKEARAAAKEKGVTEADIRRLHAEFLTGLQGVTNQFGSNFSPDQWTIARLTEEQNRKLDRLTRGVQHPGSKHTRNELMASLGGVGAI